MKRVYFVWVARDQFAFEWFADLLRGIEEKDTRGLFDLRMWITSARADTAASTLGVALDLLAARTGRDPVTGLRARARFGPPDWDALFDEIRHTHPAASTGCSSAAPTASRPRSAARPRRARCAFTRSSSEPARSRLGGASRRARPSARPLAAYAPRPRTRCSKTARTRPTARRSSWVTTHASRCSASDGSTRTSDPAMGTLTHADAHPRAHGRELRHVAVAAQRIALRRGGEPEGREGVDRRPRAVGADQRVVLARAAASERGAGCASR